MSSYAEEKCDYEICFGIDWKVVTPSDVQKVQVNARNEGGSTLLHVAASHNENPVVIIATLLDAGADVTIKDRAGETALGYAANNEKLKNTDAYWELNEAQYKN